MPHEVNTMYPKSVHKRASDIIEKVKVPGIKVSKRTSYPAHINQSLDGGYWIEVDVSQNKQNEWCLFVSFYNESEKLTTKYGKSKMIPLTDKFSDQSYINGIEKTIKECLATLSNHEDPKMFESVKKVNNILVKLIREEIQKIREEDAMDDFDLEQAYNQAPQEVKDLLDAVGDEQDYKVHERLKKQLEQLGYDYDYDLSGTTTYLAPKQGM